MSKLLKLNNISDETFINLSKEEFAVLRKTFPEEKDRRALSHLRWRMLNNDKWNLYYKNRYRQTQGKELDTKTPNDINEKSFNVYLKRLLDRFEPFFQQKSQELNIILCIGDKNVMLTVR